MNCVTCAPDTTVVNRFSKFHCCAKTVLPSVRDLRAGPAAPSERVNTERRWAQPPRARLESQTIAAKKPIAIDEAACRELNDSLQVETPSQEIFKGKTGPVQV